MALSYFALILLIGYLFVCSGGWRAVPANQASFAIRTSDSFSTRQGKKKINIDLLPRNTLHSIYRFGYCPPEVIAPAFLRNTANVSFESFNDADVSYVYLVADMKTERFKLQCVVMKFYVPRMFQLHKSRLPIYYCQGQLLIMMFDTVHRMAIHEFYFQRKISIPIDIFLEFYHPNLL